MTGKPLHSLCRKVLLPAGAMQRLTAIFGALILVLFVWTSSAAHAAERAHCLPVSSEAAGHFEGDKDETPPGEEQGLAHHHSGCNGHQFAAAAGLALAAASHQAESPAGGPDERYATSRSPDRQLRPPIA